METNTQKIVSYLHRKSEELFEDNLVLVDEVTRLRNLLQYYQQKNADNMQQRDHHERIISQIDGRSEEIIQRIAKSDTENAKNLDKKMKQMKKEIFYKRMENLQKKYDKKNQQCEKLKQFRDKLIRLRNTCDKPKDKGNLQQLYKWLYNQTVRAKGNSGTINKQKNKTIKSSNFKPDDKSNCSTSQQFYD